MKRKITKNKIVAASVILCVLTAAWFFGGGYAYKNAAPEHAAARAAVGNAGLSDPAAVSGSKQEQTAVPEETAGAKEEKPAIAGGVTSEGQAQGKAAAEETKSRSDVSSEKAAGSSKTAAAASETGKDQYLTGSAPAGKPKPAEPQNAEEAGKAYTCTLSVACKTILDNRKSFNKDKLEVLPSDGVIFAAQKVTFYGGESVFNVLQREMKKAGVQMEFASTPIYNSSYIEGIGNLYEFDCGELSGWMYKVNGWFPNYGCSRCQLRDGDTVEWVYTCDLGRDVGGDYLKNRGGGS